MEESRNKYKSRRDFVRKAGQILVVAPLVAIPAALHEKQMPRDMSGR
jgi:hypothetical protein